MEAPRGAGVPSTAEWNLVRACQNKKQKTRYTNLFFKTTNPPAQTRPPACLRSTTTHFRPPQQPHQATVVLDLTLYKYNCNICLLIQITIQITCPAAKKNRRGPYIYFLDNSVRCITLPTRYYKLPRGVYFFCKPR